MRSYLLFFLFLPCLASADRLLIAECVIGSDDEYVAAGMRFVLVYDVDQSVESIWKAKEGPLTAYASDSLEMPFESRGGAWHTILASDIRRSLRRADFRFVEDSLPPSFDALSSKPETCAFDYAGLKEYEAGLQARISE